jgi:probable addiction module antidote protein
MTAKTITYDTGESLETKEAVVAYLDAALEENDPSLLALALGNLSRAYGMTKLARKTRLSRESLYRSLSAKGNPSMATVLKVMDALGFSLQTKAVQSVDGIIFPQERADGVMQVPFVRDDVTLLRKRARNFPEMVRQLELGVDDYVVNGDFLDEFYHAPQEERQSFIAFAPARSSSPKADRFFYAHCAAETEKLARDYGLAVPQWVDNPRYFLDEPDYAGYTVDQIPERLKESLERNSPPEFSKRNLYVTANVLERY